MWRDNNLTLVFLLDSDSFTPAAEKLKAMQRLRGFYLYAVLQLSLAAQGVQTTAFSSNLGSRTYLETTPPRFYPIHADPGDAGTWSMELDRKSKPPSASNTSEGLRQTEALISKELETLSNQECINPREVDTPNRHQLIVIMEEDAAVIESATNLFERNPSESTLLSYQKGALQILRGSRFSSILNHDVILVGHGSTGTNGSVLSGFDPEELARFMMVLNTESLPGRLCTISLISCNLGNDLNFMSQLLQVLRSLGMETKLHLYNSFLSVSSDGEILTRTEGLWRSSDHRRRVIGELDQRGDLLVREELGCAGPTFPDFRGSVLYLQTLDWPRHPQMFVPRELRKKYPSIDCLEGLTWSLFFESERRRAPDYVSPQGEQKGAIWLREPGPEENIVIKHINTIQDLLVEIRFNAREEVSSNLYYVLNECIYKVSGKNLNVTLVGKFMSTNNEAEIESFRQRFNEPQGESSLQELRQGLKVSKFTDFCRQTFQFQQCIYNCERWGRYFMAAVFSASVLNFRTFSLFLMSVIGCEVGRAKGTDSPLCTAFVGSDHPMETDKPRPNHLRRGFYGCTVDNYEMAPQERQIWLDEVLAKENDLYMKSKMMMIANERDEQTELDIFGKVKVMNKYAFSSYLEFFRGTPEGKKLKRGCAPSLNVKKKT
ncbi:uncharacterized protein [Labrus bergylta]|uniref:uncharacterized protein n=1 Tax=Labrus bergylta TaxID=56723 RepID=UPI003313F271